MPQTILIKRGAAAGLNLFTPLGGELIWTTDTKRLYVGDGVTVGGIDLIGGVETNVATNVANITTVNTRIDNLTTSDIAEGSNLYYTDVRADGRIQTAISDTTTSTSTLWSSDKISSVILSGVSYQGHWDASTNTPNLVDATGTNGDFYICNAPGTVDFSVAQDGSNQIIFAVGDYVIFTDDDGAGPTPGVWEKSINSNDVQSVNGQLGTVVLGGSDILATGYAKAVVNSTILVTDTLNEAIGKLEKGIEDAQSGGEVNVQADWANAVPADDAYILNKPGDLTDLNLHSIGELLDVDTTTTSPVQDDFLAWDGINSKWVTTSPAASTNAFDDLTDVDMTTVVPSSNDLIAFDGSNWVPIAPGLVGSTNFEALTDTPNTYAGSAGFTVKVNAGGTALEFIDTTTVDGGTF